LLFCCGFVRSQTVQILHSFSWSDGAYPYGGLIQGDDGNFYGTTDNAGPGFAIDGTVFKMTPDGTLTTLVSFSQYSNAGSAAWAELLQGSDGNYYGTTSQGGTEGYGTIFKINLSQKTFATLVSFNTTNGSTPQAGLLQGKDGNFYGTTSEGGTGDYGTVFRITPAGTLTTLASFTGNNGAHPYAALTLANDGNFYGTTYSGGAYGYGTVFKLTPAGMLSTLISFNNNNGSYPLCQLVQGADGNLYGTTQQGGDNGYGSIFKLTLNGTITTLFSSVDPLIASVYGVFSGAYPEGGLIQADDGNFYGTVPGNSYFPSLTVFKMTSDGNNITEIASFSDGGAFHAPYPRLLQGNDGNLYGTAAYDGDDGYGTIFRINIPHAPRIIGQPISQSVQVGSNVTLSVTAVGTSPFSYQWYYNSASISGATSPNFTLSNFQSGNEGAYSVIVGNAYGTATSSNAILSAYSPTAMISVKVNPSKAGTVTPNYDGQTLQNGKSYKITAKAAKGCKFLGWSGGINSSSSKLTFTMEPGLSLIANFADVTRPVCAVLSPKKKAKIIDSTVTASGKASDSVAVASVYYQLNGGAWGLADGTTAWQVPNLALAPGNNIIRAYAVDSSGNISLTNSITFQH